MFYNNIDPLIMDLGGYFGIRYYGLAYAIGFLGTYFFLKHLAKKTDYLSLDSKDIDDLFLYLLLGVIIGARVVYTLVYNFAIFSVDPLRIFAIWAGGMSFHGGLIGVILAILLYVRNYNARIDKNRRSKKKKIHFYDISDVLTIPAAFALAIGRLANFTNHELYGRVTDVPWAVNFRGVSGFRHPSQIYEAIYSVIIGIVQSLLLTKKISKGLMSWIFVFLYGSFRFVTEFFRQPDVQMGVDGFFFGWVTTGHMLSVAMILIGGYMIYGIYAKDSRRYSKD